MTVLAALQQDIPRVFGDAIRRPRLTALLDQGSPLTVVRGACGAGKTVALVEWAHATSTAVIWVSIEKDAASSSALAQAILRALVRQDLTRVGEDAASRPWNAISDALRASERPLTLVLDDAAFLDREAVFDVCRICGSVPGVRVIAATNRRSPFDSEGLELMIDRTVIGPEDLMFDSEEISRALGVDDEIAAELRKTTGGFPAVIHAAARRGLPAKGRPFLEIASDAVEELMRVRVERAGVDPRMLGALVRVSVADVVDAELARTLSADPRVVGMLDEAESLGFGSWTTSGERRFTFAPLALTLLRRELQRSFGDKIPQLQRLAVQGAIRRNSPFEALRLAVEQDDLTLAGHVIMSGWTDLLDHHGRAVADLLGPVPLSRLKDAPLVAMLLAICCIASRLRRLRGLQLLRVAIAAANSRRGDLSDVEKLFIWTAESAALRLVGMPDRAGKVAARALALFRSTAEEEWEAYAGEVPLLCTQLGLSLYYGGQHAQAVEWFSYAASLAVGHKIENAFHAVSLLSGIHALNGDIPEARHYVGLIREGTWGADQRDGYRGTFYRIAEAFLAIEERDLAAARAHVKAFIPHRATSEHWVAMVITEAWLELHCGRPMAGLQQIDSAVRLRGREGRGERSRRSLMKPRVLLHLALGDLTQAKEILHRDAHHDHYATMLERARIALIEGRASDALRLLTSARIDPSTARQRAEASAVRCAALWQASGADAAAAAADVLGSQLEDRDLATPVTLLTPESTRNVQDLLQTRGFSVLSQDARFPPVANRPQLSRRELVVLRALTSGATLQTIAADLNVSQNTLKTQLRSVYRKLDANNRAEAVEKASRLALLAER